MDKDKLIKENFGKRAEKYKESTTHGNSVDLQRMADMLGNDIEMALDVATGGGHTAVKMAEYAKKVTAVDITTEMLNEARQLADIKDLTNIEFMLMDVHQLDFSDKSFDVVTSRFAPHHFRDINTALAEMTRVLKPGGKMYILDCSVIDGNITESVINHIESLRDPSHKCSYSQRQWEQMLQELPLEIENMELQRHEYQLPEWFDRTETPQEKREEIFCYLDSLTPTLRRNYLYSSMFMTTYRIEILARKK